VLFRSPTLLLSTVDTACLNIPAAKTTKTPRYLEDAFQIGYFRGSIIVVLQPTLLLATVDTACLNIPAAKTTKTPRYLEDAFQIGYFRGSIIVVLQPTLLLSAALELTAH
jgi:hypothetical protein